MALTYRTPFSDDSAQCISAYGENWLLATIKATLGSTTPPLPYGIGDDCAIMNHKVRSTAPNIVTTDSVVFGRHFDNTASAQAVGQKFVNRNLSDIAAMGGIPQYFLMNFIFSDNVIYGWLIQLLEGIADACNKVQMPVIGGDIASTAPSQAIMSGTALGYAPRPLLRQTSQLGSRLWVTGELGGSLCGKHLTFTPRVPEGQWLASQQEVLGAIDITDGLASDLGKCLSPRHAVALDLARLPISNDAKTLANTTGQEPCWHALCDGEDYELLFLTADTTDDEHFRLKWQNHFSTQISCIGKVVPRASASSSPIIIDPATDYPLPPLSGYEHFRS